MTDAGDILNRIPFKIQNVIDVKNYKSDNWIVTESIIICKGIK